MHTSKLFAALLVSSAFALPAFAHDHDHDHEKGHEHEHEHEHGHEHIGKHEHGAATLNIALDNGVLKLDIDSPAVNFIGFEHKPNSAAEKQLIKTVQTDFASGKYFVINGGDCKLSSKEVGMPEFNDNGHADMEIEYEYTCANGKIKSIETSLFAAYQGLERIDVQYVVNANQGGAKLTKENTKISFK